jgi:DNA invertase Pin-like site-specific DNA recombinase
MKCIGYVRVSTGRQAREGVSLDAQESKIRAAAIGLGADSVAFFRDEGLSGRSRRNRPGLQAALEALGPGDALICYSISRLARSIRDCLNIADEVKRRGGRLSSLSESIDTDTAAGKLLFRTLANMYEFESDIIGERVAGVWSYKRARGEKTGGAIPFGYSVRRGRLVPRAKEHVALQDMLKRRKRGESLRAIGKRLEAAGIRRRNGGAAWSAQAVKQTILSELRRNACVQV